MNIHFNEYVLQYIRATRYLGDFFPEYMEWFRSIVHSNIIQMVENDHPPIGAPKADIVADKDVGPSQTQTYQFTMVSTHR